MNLNLRAGVKYDHIKAIRDHKNPFTLKEQYLLKNNNQYILLYLDELDLSYGLFSRQIPPKILFFFPNHAPDFDPGTFSYMFITRWIELGLANESGF